MVSDSGSVQRLFLQPRFLSRSTYLEIYGKKLLEENSQANIFWFYKISLDYIVGEIREHSG
jgi:hypothetical protein